MLLTGAVRVWYGWDMRILNRKQFLAEPIGTVFFDYESTGSYSSLSVKCDAPDDTGSFFFISTDHSMNIGACDGESAFNTEEFIKLTEAAEAGERVAFYFDTSSRSDEGERFAVLDDDDVERLIKLLQTRKDMK